MNISPEQRITILIDLLDLDSSNDFLDQLPEPRSQKIRSSLELLRESPPSDEEVDEVLDDFERMFRLAMNTIPHAEGEKGEQEGGHSQLDSEDLSGLPSNDPFEDLQRISGGRLAAALRDESPRAIALVLDRVPEERAAEVLQSLPEVTRNGAFMLMRERPQAPPAVLQRLAQAAVHKSLAIDGKELVGEKLDADEKLARLLRSMDRIQRTEVLNTIQESDADAAARIREMMFNFDDLRKIEDRSLQQLLGEVDSRTLALSLHNVDVEISDKILNNLSRRARETLEEELSLLGSVPEEELQEARTTVVKAMTALDEKGELRMTE